MNEVKPLVAGNLFDAVDDDGDGVLSWAGAHTRPLFGST
jgi:hypothetical protein